VASSRTRCSGGREEATVLSRALGRRGDGGYQKAGKLVEARRAENGREAEATAADAGLVAVCWCSERGVRKEVA